MDVTVLVDVSTVCSISNCLSISSVWSDGSELEEAKQRKNKTDYCGIFKNVIQQQQKTCFCIVWQQTLRGYGISNVKAVNEAARQGIEFL